MSEKLQEIYNFEMHKKQELLLTTDSSGVIKVENMFSMLGLTDYCRRAEP